MLEIFRKSNILSRLKIKYAKLFSQGREDIELEDFINIMPDRSNVIMEPFPYIIVDNFLKPDVYKNVCEKFNKIKELGLSGDLKDKSRFHPFDMDYDGYVVTPKITLESNDPLSMFVSIQWNLLLSKLFGQITTFETDLAFHYHPKGNRTGFVHHDLGDKFFYPSNKLSNNVIFGASNTERHPFISKRKRIIAIIFYLENNGWKDGDGGGTGLYSEDGKEIIKVVEPVNNRLLAFHISKKSMHAFQQNLKDRNSIVQWFHVPDSLIS